MPSKTFSVDFETSGFRRASKQMNEISDDADDAGSSLQTAGKVGAAAIAGIATAVTAAAAGVGALIKETTEYARQVDNAAEQSGVARDRIQEIAFAAQQTSGATFDDVRDGLKELAIRSEEAANGTGEAKEAFDELGISQQFLEESSTEEVFSRVRQELQGASKRMRIFAAETIFGGEAGQRLVETLGLSSEEMQRFSKEARASGQVLSGEQIQALEQSRRAWSSLWGQIKGVGRQLAVGLTPIVQRAVPMLRGMASWVQSLFAGVDGQALTTSLSSAVSWLQRFWVMTKEVVRGAFSIWSSFIDDLGAIWDAWGGYLTERAKNAFSGLMVIFQSGAGVLSGIWETLLGTLTGNWAKAWEGMKKTASSASIALTDIIIRNLRSMFSSLAQIVPGGEKIFGGLLSDFDLLLGITESAADSVTDVESNFEFDTSSFDSSLNVDLPDSEDRPDTSPTGGAGEIGGRQQGGVLLPWLREMDQIHQDMRKAKQETSLFQQAGQTAATAVGRAFDQANNAIGQAVTSLIAGKNAAANFGRTMVNALQQVLSQLVALIPKLAIIKGIGAIAGISTGGITTIGGVLSEAIPFLDTGGKILSDGIAKVHAGETVLPDSFTPRAAATPQGGTLEASITLDELIFRLEQRRAHNSA